MNANKWVARAVLCAVCCCTSSATEGGESRTWKDATGAFTVDGEMVATSGGQVQLKLDSGKVISVELERLSADDQEYVRSQDDPSGATKVRTVSRTALSGKPTQLKNDDGKPSGKKSFPRGIASAFQTPAKESFLTEVRIHGSRYGTAQPPREKFHVVLCDPDFNPIADFPFSYSKFARSEPKWVTLKVRPTEVPKDFVICLDFKAERTKGVYVSHDAEGTSLVGLPKKKAGSFSGGDWMVRASVDQLKEQTTP